ncbi:MAG: hypothetical protein CL842_01200 [Crocinitomicaceae bacterium]|nr:hypothetical protein [Crocinitomicaceae bacterium]|tara:strand:+ start:82515 stop:82913 length:399 start_codon:yes stop_codon:yes gene_type:complete
MEKISSIILYVLLALGALVFLLGVVGDSYEPMIYVAYIFSLLAAGGALVSAGLGASAKPESIKGAAMGIGAMLLILGISYVLADDTVLNYYPEGTTESATKLSGAGLYALYILTFLAVASVLYSGLARYIKR